MKKLFLLRHAKSDWSDLGVSDHDRVLNKRGRKAAALLGYRFREFGFRPERVVCSTALRARETLDLLMQAGDLDWEPHLERRLYGASPDTILSLIHQHGKGCDSLLLVGHNPGFADVAKALAGEAKGNLFAKIAYKVPTGALITLKFDVSDFSHVRAKSGILTQFLRPKHELAMPS